MPPVTYIAYHVVMSAPDTPASASVGTFGSSGERRAEVTASGRKRPALICPIAEDVVSNIISTEPPIRSACAWLLPL